MLILPRLVQNQYWLILVRLILTKKNKRVHNTQLSSSTTHGHDNKRWKTLHAYLLGFLRLALHPQMGRADPRLRDLQRNGATEHFPPVSLRRLVVEPVGPILGGYSEFLSDFWVGHGPPAHPLRTPMACAIENSGDEGYRAGKFNITDKYLKFFQLNLIAPKWISVHYMWHIFTSLAHS